MTDSSLLPHIAEQLYNQTWEELEVLEFRDRLLFPTKALKRRQDGTVKETPILLRVPREADLRKARIKAREVGLKEGLDLDRDKDLLDNLETICLLATCIRNTTEPYEPFVATPQELEDNFDLSFLESVYNKICTLRDIANPHPVELTEMDCWTLVTAIATARHTLPLTAYAPDSQNTFMLFMVDQLCNSPAYKSFLEQHGESIPVSSVQSD